MTASEAREPDACRDGSNRLLGGDPWVVVSEVPEVPFRIAARIHPPAVVLIRDFYNDLGTLEVGKLADIVLLDANPLEDIKNTQAIWRVLKGGWVFDPEELQPPRN